MTDPIVSLLGPWSADFGWGGIAFRILLALLTAAIVGCERASKRHAAGLRTFILVSLTSCAAMTLEGRLGSRYFLLSAAAVIGAALLSMNSTVFSSKNQIKGLTTSVALWAEAVIGLTIGAAHYTLTAILFVVFLICLSMLPDVEALLKNRSNHFEDHLELKSSTDLQDFVATIRKLGMILDDIELNPAYIGSGLSVYTIAITVSSKELKKYKSHGEIIEALATLSCVSHIEEIR